MQRYEKHLENLYSADLKYGKIELKPTHGFSCFFIVEKTFNRDFIKEQAMQLLLVGCRNFDFYGKAEPQWHIGVDEVDILLNPDSTPETVALTSGWSTIEEFVDVLKDGISLRLFVPHDFYLLYDDADIYGRVRKQLGISR